MVKSLHETAKSILLKEGGVPSVSSSDNNPDRDAKSSNPNMETLHPKTKYSEPDPKHNDAEDLGGATPTSTAKENLGAKAAKVGKDKSKSGIPSVGPESPKKLSEKDENDDDSETLDEEMEISEELQEFINNLVAEGYSDEQIEEAIAENFEYIEESEEDPLDAVIAEMIEDGLSEEEIVNILSEMSKEESDETIAESVRTPAAEVRRFVVESAKVTNLDEDLQVMFEGEEFSPEFFAKAKTIFEAAVNSRVEEITDRIQENYENYLNEEVAKLEEVYASTLEESVQEIDEKVNNYMIYVTEQWLTENEVAIESGLRTELTEEFISGLRNLLAEHYIDIPEEKVSVVEELGNEIENLKEKLNEEISKNVELSNTLNEAVREAVISEAADGLTDTQAAKLKTLSENVEFTDTESFATKVQTLKESYFPIKTDNSKVIDKAESVSNGKAEVLTENLNGPMATYVKAIGGKLPR